MDLESFLAVEDSFQGTASLDGQVENQDFDSGLYFANDPEYDEEALDFDLGTMKIEPPTLLQNQPLQQSRDDGESDSLQCIQDSFHYATSPIGISHLADPFSMENTNHPSEMMPMNYATNSSAEAGSGFVGPDKHGFCSNPGDGYSTSIALPHTGKYYNQSEMSSLNIQKEHYPTQEINETGYDQRLWKSQSNLMPYPTDKGPASVQSPEGHNIRNLRQSYSNQDFKGIGFFDDDQPVRFGMSHVPDPSATYPPIQAQSAGGYLPYWMTTRQDGLRLGNDDRSARAFQNHEKFKIPDGLPARVQHNYKRNSAIRPSLGSPNVQPDDFDEIASDGTYRAIIRDEASFRSALQAYQQGVIRSKSNFPSDSKRQRVYIKRLFEAITNTDEVLDSPKVVKAFKSGEYPDKAIEIACWELLFAARDSQEMGQLVDHHHDTKHEFYGSFSDRMEKIIKSCKFSKSFCKSILAPSFVARAADQPAAELKRKGANQRLNNKKTKQNKAGQKAMKEGLVDEETGRWIGAEPTLDNENQQVSTARQPQNRKRTWSPADVDSSEPEEIFNAVKKRRTAREVDDEEYVGERSPVVNQRRMTRASTRSSGRVTSQVAKRTSRTDHQQLGREPKVDDVAGNADPDILEHNAVVPMEVEYKEIICNILEVPTDFANDYSLRDLRFYALTHNAAFQEDKWSRPDLADGYYGQGPVMYKNSTNDPLVAHFAEVLTHFQPIAVARQDLEEDGTFNEDKPDALFQTAGNLIQDQALGVIDNPLGFVDFLLCAD